MYCNSSHFVQTPRVTRWLRERWSREFGGRIFRVAADKFECEYFEIKSCSKMGISNF